jgi:hypothetical protein
MEQEETTLTDVDVVLKLIDVADDEACAIATGDKRWAMNVPARPDSDSDIVITTALREADACIRALRLQVESLKEERDKLAADLDATFKEMVSRGAYGESWRNNADTLRAQLFASDEARKRAEAELSVTRKQLEAAETAMLRIAGLVEYHSSGYAHDVSIVANGWLASLSTREEEK